MDEVKGRNPCNEFWVQSVRPELEGRLGSAFSLSNGLLGLRGSHEEAPPWGRPEFYMAGTYADGPSSLLGFHDPDHILTHPKRMTKEFLASLPEKAISTLPNLPNPFSVELSVGGSRFDWTSSSVKILTCERLMEIDKASVKRRLAFRDGSGRRTCIDSRRFVSFADRNLACLSYRVKPIGHDAAIDVSGLLNTKVSNTNGVVLWEEVETLREPGLDAMLCRTKGTSIEMAIAQVSRVRKDGSDTVLEVSAVAAEGVPLKEAVGAAASFDDNPATVQGFNFGQMHLQMAFPYGDSRVGFPIKGLTGHGYRFVNFWDMDFHMFPYYLATKPEQAHLLLEYRYNQLPAYRENAKAWGAEGAQVPWETQVNGAEETAPWLCLQEREIHISADASRMFALYDELTPRHEVMVEMGAEFIMETARFYASRIRWSDSKGAYELPEVGCPDQYHTFADNNPFISLMARWNIEYAIGLAESSEYAKAIEKARLGKDELELWRKIVSNLYIIAPDGEGIIDEFDGFRELSCDMDGISETFCAHTQAVKQPDVLAAFIPFEDMYDLETRRKNWHFYNRRTLHGSSLSLPGMAYVAARCGLLDEALYNFHKSTRMDLDDVNLDTERGVHVSGGAVEWQALVYGFGGADLKRDGLHLKPMLPRQWSRLAFTLHWQFQRVSVEITRDGVSVSAGNGIEVSVPVSLDGSPAVLVCPGETVKLPPPKGCP